MASPEEIGLAHDPVYVRRFLEGSLDGQALRMKVHRCRRADGELFLVVGRPLDLRREAAEGRNKRTASYLLGEPLVSDYLAEGLDAFGLTWSDERTTPV
jgi:hypothetical protein